MTKPSRRKCGHPTDYKPKFHPGEFIRKSQEGMVLAQIARDWEVARETLYEWAKHHPEFSNALRKGRQFCEAWWMDWGKNAMINRNAASSLGYYVWMTKNLFAWNPDNAADSSERPAPSVVYYPDGKVAAVIGHVEEANVKEQPK